jgi:TFIIF-interacting CTD phosphatase-like protein
MILLFFLCNKSNISFSKDFLPKKILVLDLDETLIHSHHDGVRVGVTVKPTGPPDFIIRVEIEKHPVRFFVYKRPHVDYFLETVRTQNLIETFLYLIYFR